MASFLEYQGEDDPFTQVWSPGLEISFYEICKMQQPMVHLRLLSGGENNLIGLNRYKSRTQPDQNTHKTE